MSVEEADKIVPQIKETRKKRFFIHIGKHQERAGTYTKHR